VDVIGDLRAELEATLTELAEFGEVWLEWHVLGRETEHLNVAIGQVTRESRKL